jgi:hypothetical protein
MAIRRESGSNSFVRVLIINPVTTVFVQLEMKTRTATNPATHIGHGSGWGGGGGGGSTLPTLATSHSTNGSNPSEPKPGVGTVRMLSPSTLGSVLLTQAIGKHGTPDLRRFTILAVKKNGGGSPRRGKGVNANPTPIPV